MQPAPQRPHRALAREPVLGMDDAAEEVDALGPVLQHDLVGVQFEPQPVVQEVLDMVHGA